MMLIYFLPKNFWIKAAEGTRPSSSSLLVKLYFMRVSPKKRLFNHHVFMIT